MLGKRDPNLSPMLYELSAGGGKGLYLECRGCGHTVRIRWSVAIEIWGPVKRLAGVCRTLRCSGCGHHGASAQIVTEHRPWDLHMAPGAPYWPPGPDYPEITLERVAELRAKGRGAGPA